MVTNTSLQSRCLIIEDQALIAMSVEGYLEDVGFEVQTVASVAQGREWLKDNTPEFVILDFMLKDGPATELARASWTRHSLHRLLGILPSSWCAIGPARGAVA